MPNWEYKSSINEPLENLSVPYYIPFQLLSSPLTHAQTEEALRNSYTLFFSYSISGHDDYKQRGLLKDM